MSIRRATASIGRDEYDDPYIDWDDDPEGEWVLYRAHVEELRACEKRVWRDADRVVNETYNAALDAARKAVVALHPDCDLGCELCAEWDDALAAIDALREVDTPQQQQTEHINLEQ